MYPFYWIFLGRKKGGRRGREKGEGEGGGRRRREKEEGEGGERRRRGDVFLSSVFLFCFFKVFF